jgi:hypothetical protein
VFCENMSVYTHVHVHVFVCVCLCGGVNTRMHM